jgi:hypothetical protein
VDEFFPFRFSPKEKKCGPRHRPTIHRPLIISHRRKPSRAAAPDILSSLC